MFRSILLAAADNDRVRRFVTAAPISRGLVRRFVAGDSAEEAVTAAAALTSAGFAVTVDHLGESVGDEAGAEDTVAAYLELLRRLEDAGLTGRTEVSVKLSAVGQQRDEQWALHNACRICTAAERVGTTVTLDAEDHTTTDSTLRVLAALRQRWPNTGAVLQAYLFRTLDDCRALSGEGSRVRLCKGAYAEPPEVAYQTSHEVALSFVRCANVLLAGSGYPMFATHDRRLLPIIRSRASWHGRPPGSLEYQMLYGVRPTVQRALVAAGDTVRIYLPYGTDWYGYLTRRIAERPANAAFLVRALVSR